MMSRSMPSSYSLSRTPKMSDFGISESTMQILSHRSHGISTTETRAENNFKMPGEPMSLFKQRRYNSIQSNNKLQFLCGTSSNVESQPNTGNVGWITFRKMSYICHVITAIVN